MTPPVLPPLPVTLQFLSTVRLPVHLLAAIWSIASSSVRAASGPMLQLTGSFTDVQATCEVDVACAAFSYNTAGGFGLLATDTEGGLVSSAGYTAYTKASALKGVFLLELSFQESVTQSTLS
eukprot:NODE_2919_length_1089_cov_21.513462_g2678_i0.p2 GENE.NODE_2919_length_1089_cov_21.513462_g2678_i0~~NODE_2919_length_1089_cov_21.513462_g2678_i0.p2  ORF type:complete len:122 (-),score=14.66 NODE_2919_length_1089_cov_21.513462_g2678_i0:268-633(-)